MGPDRKTPRRDRLAPSSVIGDPSCLKKSLLLVFFDNLECGISTMGTKIECGLVAQHINLR